MRCLLLLPEMFIKVVSIKDVFHRSDDLLHRERDGKVQTGLIVSHLTLKPVSGHLIETFPEAPIEMLIIDTLCSLERSSYLQILLVVLLERL